MSKFLCRVLGHDLMVTSARQRVCLRCGGREALRQYGAVMAWEELARAPVTKTALRPSRP
jgi:hypothetical protein